MSKRLAVIKICPACSKEFHPYNRKQVHCSKACSGQHSVTLTCTTCGKSYTKGRAMASRVKHNHYCSIECKFANKRVIVTCETCGKEFERIKSWVSPHKRNYCSKECANEGLKVEKPILICNFCGKSFERYPSAIRRGSEHGYRHVFCSHKCRAAMIAAQFDPPRPYQGPHTSAPRNGHRQRQWRKAVFEHDKHTCQDCGVSGVLLCAHHIKPYALYPTLRYKPSNGMTLCYPCHERRHSLSD